MKMSAQAWQQATGSHTCGMHAYQQQLLCQLPHQLRVPPLHRLKNKAKWKQWNLVSNQNNAYMTNRKAKRHFLGDICLPFAGLLLKYASISSSRAACWTAATSRNITKMQVKNTRPVTTMSTAYRPFLLGPLLGAHPVSCDNKGGRKLTHPDLNGKT